jgi:protein-disulfide isomerase
MLGRGTDSPRPQRIHRVVWELADRLATVLVIGVTGLLIWMVATGRVELTGSTPDTPPPPAVEDIEELNFVTSIPAHVRQGSPSARIVLIEFGDYECPFCARHARDVYPEIVRDYVESGRVQYVLRHIPVERHTLSLNAAKAAECAHEQGLYWTLHPRLFEAVGGLSESAADELAQEVGLDRVAFRICWDRGYTLEAVKRDQAEGRALGVVATPTFFVGLSGDDESVRLIRRFRGARPYTSFREVIEAVLDERT